MVWDAELRGPDRQLRRHRAGQLPAEHYYRLYRTLPPDRRWQGHEPAGEVRAYKGVPVFEGHYTYRGLQVVPSWGGSMFEALMVPLFVPEDRWAPRSWGRQPPALRPGASEYGLRDLDCGYWGFSPARGPLHHYGEYGVSAIATKPGGYPPGDVEESAAGFGGRVHGVVTPYASFLALDFARSEALSNLRSLAGQFAVYGRFGFADSVDVACGRTADAILAVDQGMILAAIANALDGDVMKRRLLPGAGRDGDPAADRTRALHRRRADDRRREDRVGGAGGGRRAILARPDEGGIRSERSATRR